jgi:DNA polymerase-1
LGSWDLNQIELRVLAIDSESQVLRDIFLTGKDLHAQTAYKIFGVKPEDQDESLHRLPAKAVNFGIPMGMTEIGLAEQMRKNGYQWPELSPTQLYLPKKKLYEIQAEICKVWIDQVLKDWGVTGYLEEKKAQARGEGFVADMWGRRRYLPSVLSPDTKIREEALRQAQSFPMQAGARGIMKQIEARVWREIIRPLWEDGYYIEPLLDIHDDLLLEFEERLEGMLLGLVKSVFETTVTMVIPITCKGKTAQAWGELK